MEIEMVFDESDDEEEDFSPSKNDKFQTDARLDPIPRGGRWIFICAVYDIEVSVKLYRASTKDGRPLPYQAYTKCLKRGSATRSMYEKIYQNDFDSKNYRSLKEAMK